MTPTVLLIGGGTGGHIYPLLAAAERLRMGDPVRLVAVCSDRTVDGAVLDPVLARGELDAVLPIPARPLLASPRGLLALARSWGPSVRAVRREIERARGPVAALSTGGFVAVPAARACRGLGVPLALVALDVPPGKATRLLARRADERLNASPVDLSGWTRVGPIVRTAALAGPDPAAARTALGLDPARRTLVVFGGSQGARTVNRFVRAFLDRHADDLARAGWQVLHQTGAHAEPAPESPNRSVRTVEFIDRVGDAWTAADLVLSRAGAGAVAEATLARRPCVFMPYPFHADDHQRRNAEELVAAGAAIVFDDRREPEANLAAHGPALLEMLSDPDRLDEMGERAQGRPALDPGAEDVARRVRALLA